MKEYERVRAKRDMDSMGSPLRKKFKFCRLFDVGSTMVVNDDFFMDVQIIENSYRGS